MSEILHSPGVLALELSAGTAPSAYTLSRDQADALARLIADDLARLLPPAKHQPGAEQADLLVLGALYDHAQLLRPGWPVLAELAELAQHSRALQGGGGGRIVAFGSHGGVMPGERLQPEVQSVPGALLLLPWTFCADEALATDLGARMESVFMAKGEAGTQTADFLMRALGLRLEHARYLTRHDLCALTCSQLEHAGFSALWQMLEFALLYPQRDGEALTSRGRKLAFREGQVHCALPAYADWVAEFGRGDDAAERTIGYAGWLFELRQYAGLFAAHQVALRFDANANDASLPVQLLADVDPALPAASLYAHEARGLGVVVITVAQVAAHGAARVLAHAWPLDQAALGDGVAQLAARFGASPQLQRLGRIVFDAAGAELAITDAAPVAH
ncbi:hypothetical protein [Tahibacter sp.]|uniref:hypothetical protein n=1 Tax=Tahibacter sp. TaxID=2056211 RepID=UPI0028C43E5B|nr:hypothetical protein [Tahibacter sp.]